MITKITAESFKSLEKVDVELGSVNVFVGANGSGKSNLLEAVGVLGAAAFGRVDDESLLRRGVRPGVPQLYKSAFPTKQAEKRPHISFSAENSEVSYKVSLWNPLRDPELSDILLSLGKSPYISLKLQTPQYSREPDACALLRTSPICICASPRGVPPLS